MAEKKPTAQSQDNQAMETLSFEESLSELDQLVQQLESGELDLEASLKNFERGIALARVSQQKLTAAQQRVDILLADDDNAPLSSFEEDDQYNSSNLF